MCDENQVQVKYAQTVRHLGDVAHSNSLMAGGFQTVFVHRKYKFPQKLSHVCREILLTPLNY